MKKPTNMNQVRQRHHKQKQRRQAVELVSINAGKVIVRIDGQEQEVEYGHFIDVSQLEQEELRRRVELMGYMNEHPEQFCIYHFALKYLAAFEIEFLESVNAISWKYADDHKTAIIYKKPWKDNNGQIYFGEMFDKHAVCKRKFLDTKCAIAFIDEATKAMEKEQTEIPAGLGRILFVGTKDEANDYLRREKEGKLSISELRPAWETAECWNALDSKSVKCIFAIDCEKDTSAAELDILHNIVRMYSGILTSDEVIRMVSDNQLRMKHDKDLEALVESMRKAWVHYMPPMYFADQRPIISIDWRDYINDREHGKIVVTFKTEFLY